MKQGGLNARETNGLTENILKNHLQIFQSFILDQ